MRFASAFTFARYSRSIGSGDPTDIETPCITIGYRSAIWSSTHAGRPPVSRKFSVTISNQSTGGFLLRMWPKWAVRRPTPSPRSGRSKRPILGAILVPDRNGATALSLAAVPARAAIVAALAAAQPLAPVLALAVVAIRDESAAALPLAAVLARAAVVPRLAAAQRLAPVHALAGMVVHDRLTRASGQHDRAARQPRRRGRDGLRELPSIDLLLHGSSIPGARNTNRRAQRISGGAYNENEESEWE